MRNLPALAVAGALVFVAFLTDMAAQDASAEQTEQTNQEGGKGMIDWAKPVETDEENPRPDVGDPK